MRRSISGLIGLPTKAVIFKWLVGPTLSYSAQLVTRYFVLYFGWPREFIPQPLGTRTLSCHSNL